jgi:hypothetical protein
VRARAEAPPRPRHREAHRSPAPDRGADRVPATSSARPPAADGPATDGRAASSAPARGRSGPHPVPLTPSRRSDPAPKTPSHRGGRPKEQAACRRQARRARPRTVEVEGYEGHLAELDGYTVAFEAYSADADMSPLFVGLPDDPLPVLALGLRDQGQAHLQDRRRRRGLRGRRRLLRRPGHIPVLSAGTEVVEFSPTERARTRRWRSWRRTWRRGLTAGDRERLRRRRRPLPSSAPLARARCRTHRAVRALCATSTCSSTARARCAPALPRPVPASTASSALRQARRAAARFWGFEIRGGDHLTSAWESPPPPATSSTRLVLVPRGRRTRSPRCRASSEGPRVTTLRQHSWD